MNNEFSGLSVGLRALQTQRKSLDVTGHNIANANNEDYNKQRAVHKASYPYTAPGLSNHGGAGQFGTGVEIEQVERVKDQFINSQIFNETQTSGYWEEMERGLEKVEYILNEPSDSGISSAMNDFWSSLQDLSNNPSDNAARNMVRENAKNLVDSFKSVRNQLNDYKASINENLSNTAEDINNITQKMADLNKQIVSVKGSGQNPNDLIDQRDGLYKDLNELINVQSRKDDQGNLIVSTDGMQLVNGSDSYKLKVESGEAGEFNSTLKHSKTGTVLEPDNGQVGAWMEMRDKKLDFYRGKLDTLASEMVNEFNTRHKNGYDAEGNKGGNFFKDNIDPSEDLKDREQSAVQLMSLSSEIDKESGLSKIAAGSYSGNPSVVEIDKTNATAAGDYSIDVVEDGDQFKVSISSSSSGEELAKTTIDKGESVNFDSNQLTDTAVVNDDGFEVDDADAEFILTPKESGSTEIGLSNSSGSGDNAGFLADLFDDSEVMDGTSVKGFFRSIVSTAGAETQRASEMNNNQDQVLKQLNTLDRSISGVSLDEEMANLIKYQQSYNAAAKYITKTDELLQTLMSIV